MALTQAQEAIYRAAIKADSNFSAELKRVYGKRSQDMRYRPNLWTDRKLKAVALRSKRANERWMKIMRSFREKNPGRQSVHTAKWDRCVKEVRKRGTAADPYAVCTAAMGELAIRKPHRARLANPLPRLATVRPVYYAVVATHGTKKYWLKRNGKLTAKAIDAARFKTVTDAEARANQHLRQYPTSRSYRFGVQLAY